MLLRVIKFFVFLLLFHLPILLGLSIFVGRDELLTVLFLFSLLLGLCFFAPIKLILVMLNAKLLPRSSNAQTYKLLDNMSFKLKLKRPDLYVIEDESVNCISCSIFKNNSTLILTSGSINKLRSSELEAMLCQQLFMISKGGQGLRTTACAYNLIIYLMALLFRYIFEGFIYIFWRDVRKREKVLSYVFVSSVISLLDRTIMSASDIYEADQKAVVLCGENTFKSLLYITMKNAEHTNGLLSLLRPIMFYDTSSSLMSSPLLPITYNHRLQKVDNEIFG